jgi:hypothetical protein
VHDGFFFARAFEETIQLVLRMPEDTRGFYDQFALAASYALLGRAREAETAKAALASYEGASSPEIALNQTFLFARQQEQDLFVEAYRRLGLTVCAKPEDLAKIKKPVILSECEAARGKIAVVKVP